MAAGFILRGDPEARSAPKPLHGALDELRRRYSPRPGETDAALIDELGLFDYLSGRFTVYGTPAECHDQVARHVKPASSASCSRSAWPQTR